MNNKTNFLKYLSVVKRSLLLFLLHSFNLLEGFFCLLNAQKKKIITNNKRTQKGIHHPYSSSHQHIFSLSSVKFLLSHQPQSNAVNDVGVVQAAAVVLEGGADVETRLVVPEGQKVVQLVIGHGLGRRGHGVPSGGVGSDGLWAWEGDHEFVMSQ